LSADAPPAKKKFLQTNKAFSERKTHHLQNTPPEQKLNSQEKSRILKETKYQKTVYSSFPSDYKIKIKNSKMKKPIYSKIKNKKVKITRQKQKMKFHITFEHYGKV